MQRPQILKKGLYPATDRKSPPSSEVLEKYQQKNQGQNPIAPPFGLVSIGLQTCRSADKTSTMAPDASNLDISAEINSAWHDADL